MNEKRAAELGHFLRSRRERLAPADLGLPAGRRRRTRGLRREEVAMLAGIGVDWYVRLEQGRAVNPSSTTVDALARALRLAPAEHAHLRALSAPPARRPYQREVVPETLRKIVEGLNSPAYVTGRRWDVLAWNAAADELFAYGRQSDADRNSLVAMLTRSSARRLFGDGWSGEAQRMLQQFRATHDLDPGDPELEALLDRLRAGCPEFEGWWRAHEVGAPGSGRKVLTHPTKGGLSFEYATFQANGSPDLRLTIYSPI